MPVDDIPPDRIHAEEENDGVQSDQDSTAWDDVALAAARAGEMYQRFMAGLEERPVDPQVDRETLRNRIYGTIGESGIGAIRVIEEIEQILLPSSMSTPHPCYAGLVNSSPLPVAPIADLVVSMLNNNGGAFHQSPSATTAEEEVIRAFCEVLGYEKGAAGLLLPGGTFANLHGLLLARTAKFPDWRRKGPGAAHEPRIYCSAAVHFSVIRAASVVGVGEDNAIAIPINGRGAMDVAALRQRILLDRDAGATPFAVVATVGTTGTGAVDDVKAIADVCDETGVWLHVDACYGGAVALVKEGKRFLANLDLADSVAVDPHKWFFMPMVAGLVLTRHPEVERAAFGIDVSYIPQGGEPDAFIRGVPTSRRSSGLALWAALRAHGWGPIRRAVRRNIDQMRLLEKLLAAEGFHILPDGEMSIACARFEPEGGSSGPLDSQQLDTLQVEISRRVISSGKAWFSTTTHAGKTWLRFNVVNLHTRDRHIHRIAEAVVRATRESSTS